MDRRPNTVRILTVAAAALVGAAFGACAAPSGPSVVNSRASAPVALPPSTMASSSPFVTANDATASATPAITGLTGHIVFARAGGRYGEDTLFVVKADGTDERQIGDVDRGSAPWASRDGARIVFGTYGPETQNRGTAALTDVSAATPTLLPLPAGTINLGSGPFSPDGSRILREGWDDQHPDAAGIYVTRVDGTALRRLTKRHFIPADWSPDGTHLLLFAGANGEPPPPGQLYIANADGTNVTEVTPPSVLVKCCGNDRYSPDGTRILYATEDGGIWTIAPDGSNPTKVFQNPAGHWAISPTWSPDGSMILFALDSTSNPFSHSPNVVDVIRSDGSGLTQVLGGDNFKRELVWVSG